MTREDIIAMAREADREWDCDRDMVEWLEWFAGLVASAERNTIEKEHQAQYEKFVANLQLSINAVVDAEREECAKVAEYCAAYRGSALRVAAAIRARGETTSRGQTCTLST